MMHIKGKKGRNELSYSLFLENMKFAIIGKSLIFLLLFFLKINFYLNYYI